MGREKTIKQQRQWQNVYYYYYYKLSYKWGLVKKIMPRALPSKIMQFV